jgi:hypothetical protein
LRCPWDLPDLASITAWAEDEAGNSVLAPLARRAEASTVHAGNVELSEQFLATKLPELLPERAPIPKDQFAAAFLIVQSRPAKKAEDTKRQLAARTRRNRSGRVRSSQPRNTKVFSNFAESRSYRYNGQQVDTAVHLGFDLASLKQSPVPAANSGSWCTRARSPSMATPWSSTTDSGCKRSTDTSRPSASRRATGQAGAGARRSGITVSPWAITSTTRW